MAAKYAKEAESLKAQNVSISELEKALAQITQEVAEEKQELNATFQHLHQMLVEKEETLMAELDAIPADISAKIEERRESLEQLTQLREETEKKLQAKVLNDFLKQQLSGIQNQMEKILSEQILFSRVSLSCHTKNIQKTLEDNCHITKTPNPYIFRTLPLWDEGKGRDLLSRFSDAICIDRKSQLIYVGHSDFSSYKIQVFNLEGEHQSTLLNKEFKYINSIQTHGDNIYVSSIGDLYKLNKKGDTIKKLKNQRSANSFLFIEDIKLYSCSLNSSTVMVYDLNLKYSRSITLQPLSFDENTFTRDIIVKKQQIFILFGYYELSMYQHPDPIQIFQLDGTLIRSLVTGSSIRYAHHFCMDYYENILVSDTEGNCIRIFSPEGILIQSIGGDGELKSPGGIAIDSEGRIIILNRKRSANLQAF